MNFTNVAPKGSPKIFKRTKIVATVGPATYSYEAIRDVIHAGANMIRLNFSHGTNEERLQQLEWVRKASQELGKPVAILQDLQGPKIRLGDFDGIINVQTGDTLSLAYLADYEASGHVPTQYDLSKKVKVGERLYLFDGRVRTKVTKVVDNVVYVNVENNGILIKRKGINLPDTDFGGDILTKKDLEDIRFGTGKDFDYVGYSFVQTAEDIENLRELMRKHGREDVKIIAKIETKAAVANLEAIVKASDAVMVARGDLAVETPAESVPVVQREIVRLGQQYGKPTIVATQMLMSMMDMPEPTRAEVSDIATAVFMGADAVMLSDETAMGKYPVDSVKTMERVIKYSEQHPPISALAPCERQRTLQNAIASSTITLAENIDAKAIVASTKSGDTAVQISSHRPQLALIAVTNEVRTAQQLALVYGIKSYVRPADSLAAQKLTDWLRDNDVLNAKDVVVTVSGRHPGVPGGTDTIKVRVLE